MREGPKITITIRPTVDNQIQFCDALMGAVAKLTEIADEAMRDGDHEHYKGTDHFIVAANDDADHVGKISIGK